MTYCNKWNIEVKSDKTKVVVFRNGWRSVKEHFYHNGKESAIVNSYVYLGMLLNSNGKCLHTQKRLAMSSLINSLKQLYVTKEHQMYLFDSMVESVLGYASEIWGFHRARSIDFLHNRFCRYVLKLGKNVPLPFLYGELVSFSSA